MRPRRAALAAATVLVAAFVALAVPVSQLRTFAYVTTCCCPNPDDCHCPPAPPSDGHDSIRRCHNTMNDVVTGAVPTLVPPALAPEPAAVQVAIAIASPIAAPHPSPPPARPAAPS